MFDAKEYDLACKSTFSFLRVSTWIGGFCFFFFFWCHDLHFRTKTCRGCGQNLCDVGFMGFVRISMVALRRGGVKVSGNLISFVLFCRLEGIVL